MRNFQSERVCLVNSIEAWKTLQLVDVGTPLRRFDYPSSKRQTATSTVKLRDAENQLDQFWQTVDDHFKKKTGMTLHQLLSGILLPRALQRTPEWVEPTPTPSQQLCQQTPPSTTNFRSSTSKSAQKKHSEQMSRYQSRPNLKHAVLLSHRTPKTLLPALSSEALTPANDSRQ